MRPWMPGVGHSGLVHRVIRCVLRTVGYLFWRVSFVLHRDPTEQVLYLERMISVCWIAQRMNWVWKEKIIFALKLIWRILRVLYWIYTGWDMQRKTGRIFHLLPRIW